MDANTSNDSNCGNDRGNKDAKRQQFTNKQRMDMYAFCVLELEMHSNKVSIKKQQQAIQKVLFEQQKEGQKIHQQQTEQNYQTPPQILPPSTGIQNQDQLPTPQADQLTPEQTQPPNQGLTVNPQLSITPNGGTIHHQQSQPNNNGDTDNHGSNNTSCNSSGTEGKTLLQLQEELAMTRKCYSDYQKTQVLTSSMLRDVQKRFAKYYPDSAIPSRSTIKHVFEKCVTHGTVENIRTRRKATKIPQGDEIEYLLIHEPQLSLRQMAQKLNVSTGTVSRRCKALGLVPESVAIKHQQLATARRQKQIKLETQSRAAAASAGTSNGNHNS